MLVSAPFPREDQRGGQSQSTKQHGTSVTPTAPGSRPPTSPARPQPGWTKVRPRSSRELRITRMEGGQGFLPPCRPLGRSAEKQQPFFAGQDTLSLRRG